MDGGGRGGGRVLGGWKGGGGHKLQQKIFTKCLSSFKTIFISSLSYEPDKIPSNYLYSRIYRSINLSHEVSSGSIIAAWDEFHASSRW